MSVWVGVWVGVCVCVWGCECVCVCVWGGCVCVCVCVCGNSCYTVTIPLLTTLTWLDLPNNYYFGFPQISRVNSSCADVQQRLDSTEVSYTKLEVEKNDLKQVSEQLEAKVQMIMLVHACTVM